MWTVSPADSAPSNRAAGLKLMRARCFLQNGYRVLAWYFCHPLGEVNLIVRRGRLLVFVEVKVRANRDAGPYVARLPSGGALSRVLLDLSRAIHIMRA